MLQAATNELNLSEKGARLSFEKASFTLVSSLSHPFGVRLKGLSAEYKKDCKKHFLLVDTVVLPVKLLPLYREQKIDLGLIRFSDANFKSLDVCGSDSNSPAALEKIVKPNRETEIESKIEFKIISFFQKLKKINSEFLNSKQLKVKYKGLVVYDLELYLTSEDKLFIDRFKALKGAGKLKYKGEWEAQLFLDDSKAKVSGEVVGHVDVLKALVFFKKKESELKLELNSFTDQNKKDKVKLSLKSVPLSFLSRFFKETDFAGLNLRKTWLESALEAEISKEDLVLQIKTFKIYGDFGLIETDAADPDLVWKKNSWSLVDAIQLKLHKINFFEILADRPQKKMSQVFKDFGKFNALVKLKSLDRFDGDFETNDFSVSVRSRGRKAYQKIKSARGSLSYRKKKTLDFNLESVILEKGDFEGFIRLSYDYKNKNIKTNFDVQHLRFAPAVTTELLGLDKNQDFFIKGEGYISKTNLTKSDKRKYTSELEFKLGSPLIKTLHWEAKKVISNCNLHKKILGCRLSLENLSLSKALSSGLKLKAQNLKKVKSTSFVYEDKHLRSVLKAADQKLKFDWSSKEGMSFSTPRSDKIFVRQL